MIHAPTVSNEAAAVEGGHVLAVVHGDLLRIAAGCGAVDLARRYVGTVTRSEQTDLLDHLRRAFRARGNPDQIADRLAVLVRAERDLATLHRLVDEVSEQDAADIQAGLVDLMHNGMQDARMRPFSGRRGSREWRAYLEELVRRGEDAILVELAAEEAGNQEQLATLAGLREETLSRVKTGSQSSGFSETTRAWFLGYLLDPKTPPPPMEQGPGPKAKAGASAPQIWVNNKVHAAFMKAARRTTQEAVLADAMEAYLRAHDGPIPMPKIAKGPMAIRTRVPTKLLERFDARVGGAGARPAHLRAALAAVFS